MGSAREVAVLTLAACERQGAWSDGFLKKMLREQALDRRDAALASRLCYGVLQNKLLLDWNLEKFCKIRLDALEIKVLCCLRVAAYQLMFLDKIPASAAVNEAVMLTKKHCRNPRAAGMVNGILRSMLRQGICYEPETGDKLKDLSLKYSHPVWLVKEFLSLLGEKETEVLLAADNQQPPITTQINTLQTDSSKLTDALRADGAEVEPHPWMPGCLLLGGTGDLEQLQPFREGKFYVQDVAARLSVSAAGVMPGDRVLDCCAAPGGKSFAVAIDMANRGEVISCDIHPHKIMLISAGKERLGLSVIRPMLQSATELQAEWLDRFDVVIVDVPCSGLGIIRKKPDIRYKDPDLLKGLPRVQQSILNNCSKYVRPGGVLLYSTCTLLRQENENVVNAFLAIHPQFVLEPFELPHFGIQPGWITFWPHTHGTDGFFVAKLCRKFANKKSRVNLQKSERE